MKMRCCFVVLLFLIPLVGAVEFSPSNLVYLLEPSETLCQMIEFDSKSKNIIVKDTWAENKNVEWDIDLFENDASYHGLTLKYDGILSVNDEKIEVCLSGEKSGEYHGVIVFEEAREKNSVTQWAVWLKVIIEPKNIVVRPISSNVDSRSSNRGEINLFVQVVDGSDESKEIEKISADWTEKIILDDKSQLTGNVAKEKVLEWKKMGSGNVALIFFTLFVMALLVFIRKIKNNTP